jgi:serine/threonine-protein kinase
MSPEQARGLRSVDQRSDLWSLGVIAYRCIIGTLPFEGEAVGDLLVKLCTAPIPVPSQIAPDVPPGFDAWLHKALERDPGQRFQSAGELAQSLAIVCGLSVRIGDMLIPSSMQSGPYVAVHSASTPLSAHLQGVGSGNVPAAQVTGAPLTQTPAPRAKSRAGAFLAAGFAAAVVLALAGFGLAKVMGLTPGAPSAAASPPSPSAEPAVTAPAEPSPEPPTPPPAASSAPQAASAAPPVASAPPVKPAPAPRPRAVAAPRPKPAPKPKATSKPARKTGEIDLGY